MGSAALIDASSSGFRAATFLGDVMGSHVISNPLPVPEHCDRCCSVNVEFASNARLYGREFGKWPKCYICNDCGASVGCHPNTRIPLGRMANRKTRALRAKAHASFDKLWRGGYMTRDQSYTWLANQLNIEPSECHMSQLSDENLRKAQKLSDQYLETHGKTLIRRQKKKANRDNERHEREHKQYQWRRAKR